MTFLDEIEDNIASEANATEMYLQEVGETLLRIVQRADQDGRVNVGVYPCAEDLQQKPEQVMLCILPDAGGSHDVTIDIEHKLIEAYCLENDVCVMKVMNSNCLSNVLLNTARVNSQDNGWDLSCILIKHPEQLGKDLNDWKLINMYCNKMLYTGESISPSVRLPD